MKGHASQTLWDNRLGDSRNKNCYWQCWLNLSMNHHLAIETVMPQCFKASIAITNLKNRNCLILASFPSPFSLVIRLPFLSLSLPPPFPFDSLASTFCIGNPSPQSWHINLAMCPVHLHSLPWLILSHVSLDFLSMNSWFRKEITLVGPIHLYAPSHLLNRKLGFILFPSAA